MKLRKIKKVKYNIQFDGCVDLGEYITHKEINVEFKNGDRFCLNLNENGSLQTKDNCDCGWGKDHKYVDDILSKKEIIILNNILENNCENVGELQNNLICKIDDIIGIIELEMDQNG